MPNVPFLGVDNRNMHPNAFFNVYVVIATFCVVVFLLRTYRKQAKTRRIRRIESRLIGW